MFDVMTNHLFEESNALNVYDTTVVNLGAGCPGPDLMEPLTNMMNEATKHRMNAEKNNNCYLFQYGPTAGLWNMRQALSEFLSKKYGDVVKRESLILTCGATHGLHLLISTVLASNGVIFVEEYTYMIALQLFKEFPNVKIVQVPLDPDGVNVESFEDIINNTKSTTNWEINEEKPYWAFFYTIPIFHNPTSVVLPPKKCEQVVRIAKKYDILIVCDDVYNLLYYGDEPNPPLRLFAYDKLINGESNNVVSNGSFSKILAPGMRVGWMEVPHRLAVRFRQSGLLHSGGSVNNVIYGIMQSFFELGYIEKQLEWYKTVYKSRMKGFCESLREHLPLDSCNFVVPQGGYFVWVSLPAKVNAESFIDWCVKNGGPVAIPASRFHLKPNELNSNKLNYIRFSIGFHNERVLNRAAQQFAQNLKQYTSGL